jgi:hypothetical protein
MPGYRLIINDFEKFAISRRAGEKLVRRVLDDTELGARARLLSGPYTHGHLATKGRKEVEILPGIITGRVIFRAPYARSVNSGARPHMIFPHGDYPLRFFWRKVGREVRLLYVKHPGQKGKGYLTEALDVAARRHGFRLRRI